VTREYPRISRGLGKLTPALWDRIMRAVEFVEREGPMLQRLQSDKRGGIPSRRPALVRPFVILGSQVAGTEPEVATRWLYQWSVGRLELNAFGVPTVTTDPEGVDSDTDGYGLGVNLEEMQNFDGIQSGYGIVQDQVIATATPNPFPNQSVVPGFFERLVIEGQEPLLVPMLFGSAALDIECVGP
jgi:hypothetical protein